MNEEKSDQEWLEVAKQGGRVRNRLSLFGKEECPDLCQGVHNWRTIVCDGETDVVECRRCGLQKETACNFDDEYN